MKAERYPKIETLFDRDPTTFKVKPHTVRMPEFLLVNRWHVTEKIDGTNIRVHLHPDGSVTYGGRTDSAQLYAPLVKWLTTRLPADRVAAVFEPGTEAILYGEGYGPKIQKGGGNYRPDVSFRLFDVAVLSERVWWLAWSNIEDIANKLQISTVPVIAASATLDDAIKMVHVISMVAAEESNAPMFSVVAEGVVARTDPLLFTHKGERVMWKLKVKDY